MKRQLLLPLLMLAAACSGEEAFPPPARLAIPAEAVLASLGELNDTAEVQVLASVGVAALSETGRFLAVGERAVPPFVRVLDRETGRAWSFGPRGRGPGELTSAYSLGFLGDSVLLVLNHQRLERFRVTGQWLGGHRLSDTGLLVSAITVGCGGRVFAYGAPAGRDTRSRDSVPWVHELELDPSVSSTDRLWIPGPAGQSWGALFGFDGSADGLLLWHKFRKPEVGYWIPCDGREPTVWSHTVSRAEVEAISLVGDDRAGMVLRLPDTLFSGAAVRGSAKIRAVRWDWNKPGAQVTSFQVVDSVGCREVEFFGNWTLHDAHAHGLVLATRLPFPMVRLIDWNWFEEMLTPAHCPPLPGRTGRRDPPAPSWW